MRPCKSCHRRTMVRTVSTPDGGVVFSCTCGARVLGSGHDRKIGGSSRNAAAASGAEKFDTYVRSAPYTRTVLKVDKECPNCGLDLGMLRLGSEEKIVFVCTCGWKSFTQK